MDINIHTRTADILSKYPECHEFLYPFQFQFAASETLGNLSGSIGFTGSSLVKGLQRYVKRAEQNPCDFEKMRSRLIVPGAVNIAGFVHFLWHEPLILELKARADALKIKLNINLFPRHLKNEFQNYLSLCNSVEDLPEILIGKGFSSLFTTRFLEKFVSPGHFRHNLSFECMDESFYRAGFSDREHQFHPFGIEEMMMVYDKSIHPSVAIPDSWDDLLTPEYKGMVCQMGKDRDDHLGFGVMLYLFSRFGVQGVRQYAENVKIRQHFSHTVKNMGTNHSWSVPVNIMHQFAASLIRSSAKGVAEIVIAKEGNPGICHYFLIRNTADIQSLEMASHLFSPAVKSIIENSGGYHVMSSPHSKIRWIGWDTIRLLPMPLMKEYLAEIAYEYYKN